MILSIRFSYLNGVLLSALCALAIAGCWISGDDETPSNVPTHISEPVQREELTPSNQVAHTSESAPVGEPTPSNSTVQGDYITSPKRHVPAPLRLKIFESTAIIRASLVSSAASTERYSAADGTGVDRDKESIEDWWPQDGEDRAVHRFRFRVTEYLKGSGASEITVSARTLGTYGTEALALKAASDSLGERDTSRDTHEAVLFLWEPTSSAEFRFLRSGPYPSLHYTIDTLNRVWLPSKDPPASGNGSSSPDDSSLLFLTEESLGATPPTISLEKVRSEIAAVDTLLEAGDGTDEYKECVVKMWRYEHHFAGATRGEPFVPSETVRQLPSGGPEGTALFSFRKVGPEYNRSHIKGADKDLFRQLLVDDDDRADNGYTFGEATTRPLPVGTYRYKSYFQPYDEIPCNFIRGYHVLEKVVVVAPSGVLHELFFDPVTVGSAVVADSSNGMLRPASFTDANGASATLSSISYEAGTVKMTLSPHTGLADHVVDFIELDGTVSLSLIVAAATVDAANDTLNWSVSSQPWHDGDKLMVRIREAPPAPVFESSSYTFDIAEDAQIGTEVGSVSATDHGGDTVTYAITAGNEDDKFAIDTSTGAVTVAGALDYETVTSYTLTVEASDESGYSATATVEIGVTDVAEDAPPAPGGLDVTLSDGTFTITWNAVTGAARYEAQHHVVGSEDDWESLAATMGTSATYSPTDGPACGTTYEFRVRAYGDGTTYLADWGEESGVETVTTAACNRDPAFDPASYSFSIGEDALVDDVVGTVSATDLDQGDTVTYAITAGNEAGKFAIVTSTGAITVAAALDYETDSSYTLTVEASDGRGGNATATVEIGVTDVAEDAPPAPGGLDVTLSDGTFTITWNAVTGAARYEAQHHVVGSEDDWTSLPATTGTSATFSPTDGPACGTTYEFRVRAYGDGTTYLADWG